MINCDRNEEGDEKPPLSPLINFEVKLLKNQLIEKQEIIDKLNQENENLKQMIVEIKLRTNAAFVENESQINYLNDVIKKLCQKSADLTSENELLQTELKGLKNKTAL